MKRPKPQPDLLNAPSRGETHTRWFSDAGCVVDRGDRSDVLVWGTLIGSFEKGEVGMRNLVLVTLAANPKMHLGRLAKAFGLSQSGLALIREAYEKGGPQAVLDRRRRGGVSTVGPRVRKQMEKLFEEGQTIDQVRERVSRTQKMSRAAVGRFHALWAAAKQRLSATPTKFVELQSELELSHPVLAIVEVTGIGASTQREPENEVPPIRAPSKSDESPRMAIEMPNEAVSSPVGVVQHLGAWLMVAMVARLGLYADAQRLGEGRVTHRALRVALDAVVIALSVGERCVEGVRRLATSSAAALLLASGAPSPSWTRRTLGRFAAEGGGLRLHLALAQELLEVAVAEDPILPGSCFTEVRVVKGEKLGLYESRINLGSGQGRVRRIAVRMPDGYQVNLLAVSKRPAKALVEVMSNRWRQENG